MFNVIYFRIQHNLLHKIYIWEKAGGHLKLKIGNSISITSEHSFSVEIPIPRLIISATSFTVGFT